MVAAPLSPSVAEVAAAEITGASSSSLQNTSGLLRSVNYKRVRPAGSDPGPQFVTFIGSRIPRWQEVTSRHHRQSSDNGRSWRKVVKHFQALPPGDLLESVNQKINKAAYVSDANNWNTHDYWATPLEFLQRGGDCEDFAIAKYFVLRSLGFSPVGMKIAVGESHAVLIVDTKNGPVVLDNKSNTIRPLDPRAMKKILFTVNEIRWSVNVERSRQGLAFR